MVPKNVLRPESLSRTDSILAQKYSSDFSIPYELAQIVAGRFPEYSEAKLFLFPDVDYLHDPWSIPDIARATDQIIVSLNQKEGVLIYCHDDVDGYTSAAIMCRTLKELSRNDGETISVYPIVREKDGYILNAEVLRAYREKGVKLVVTVDFGVSSEQNFRVAKAEGLKLVVCDHHETNQTDYSAPAVNPKRPDSKYPFRELAGVGVTFKLAQCLYQKAFSLTPDEFYNLKREFFALTMIGTFSDRVVLQDENRVFCSHGLQIFNQIDAPWIKYFRRGEEFTVVQVIKEIIPTIGSAAYIDPRFGVEVLASRDMDYVTTTLETLKTVNVKRRQGVALLFEEAVSAAKVYQEAVVAVIPFSKRHYLGTVSARLRECYNRTSVVIGISDDKCFGELRSRDINLYEMLYHFKDLFMDFGGHSKAAGFTMSEKNLDRFVSGVIRYVQDGYKEVSAQNHKAHDLPVAVLNKSNVNILLPLAPFGEGNPAPILTDGTNIYTIDNEFNIREKEISGQS